MFTSKLVLCSILITALVNADEKNFVNVKIVGYGAFTKKFEITIPSSNSLADSLPKRVIFDRIDIINENVPILYSNSISDIDSLDELIMENDELKEIRPGAFKNVPQLRKLVLKNNRIEEIKEGVFNNLPISDLNLSGNRIEKIDPNALNNLPDLLNINLADNRILKWDSNWFQNTPLLSRISIQNNSISSLNDDDFKNLQGEKHFYALLLTLNLVFSHNKIETVSRNAFNGIRKLNNLWLDNNLLSTFDGKCIESVAVADLRLDSNRLTCFQEADLETVFRSSVTHIDDNPFDCICLQGVIDWAKKSGKRVEMTYAKLTCDAERIKRKMDALQNRLKEIKTGNSNKEVETSVETMEK